MWHYLATITSTPTTYTIPTTTIHLNLVSHLGHFNCLLTVSHWHWPTRGRICHNAAHSTLTMMSLILTIPCTHMLSSTALASPWPWPCMYIIYPHRHESTSPMHSAHLILKAIRAVAPQHIPPIHHAWFLGSWQQAAAAALSFQRAHPLHSACFVFALIT